MARKYGTDRYGKNRYHIITAKNGFHGRTYGAISATGQPDSAIQQGFMPVVPGFTYAEFNNLNDFASKVTPDTIAVMIEPVQGEGGVYPATQEFMTGLRKLCDEREMLLLFDEVQTGWGRTGTVMAYMGYGVRPDAVSMAKAMGAAYLSEHAAHERKSPRPSEQEATDPLMGEMRSHAQPRWRPYRRFWIRT